MGRLVNNAKWSSSLDGRLASDDVCIDVVKRKSGELELHLEFDAQEQAIISLSVEQRQKLLELLS